MKDEIENKEKWKSKIFKHALICKIKRGLRDYIIISITFQRIIYTSIHPISW